MTRRWSIAAVHCSAGGAHPLDDRWGTAHDLAWVIDGATDLGTPVLFLGAASNASWLAEQLSRQLGAGEPVGTGVHRLSAALDAVDAEAAAAGVAAVEDFPTAVGVLARALDDTSAEITVIGDCLALVERVTPDGVVVERVDDPAWSADAGAPGPDEAELSGLSDRDLLSRQLAARRRRNTPDGRWILRREPEAAEHAHVVIVDQLTGRLVLCSDGAERALRRPDVSTATLLDAAFTNADDFVNDLRAWESTRPAELPAWWSVHDDVTLLALQLRPLQ